jgi:ligand-binding sensor domain-containing protein
LFCYDGKTLRNITEENGLENLEFRKGIPNNKMGSLARVWSINDDKQGNIWIGTIDAGVWKYDGKKLINYTTKDGLAGNSIWKIYKDNNGELWFVTDGNSICKIKDNKFVKYEFY